MSSKCKDEVQEGQMISTQSIHQGGTCLLREAFYEAHRNANEVVVAYEFTKVLAEHIECQAQVVSEAEMLLEDKVVRILRVFVAKVLEDLYLIKCLLVEPSLVAYDSERLVRLALVIKHLRNLSKGAAPKHLQHLVSVGNVVILDHVVLSSVIVEPAAG
jgi:hypothetical protein